ncbi:hypothetical protein CY35_04G148300 [Sphagnum magellanicum]|nr:hypothetical protein CY35_04G148300 [Sphagnum magellanicum]KAH9566803.1 hypothetical protein CY35_04G148300 [Sphagnum magellanicum]KAH9566804.1 hypothetical protein CY35_04G148300 [Sphagnum magellanicum]
MGSHPLSPQQGQARLVAGAGTPPSNPGNGTTGADSLPLTLPSGGSRFGSLARQASIYSLTLDEFQNAMTEPGKNFGSMNMDEFLKNIWTAEESQAMAAAMGSIGEGSSSGGPTHGNSLGMLSRQPSLQRQGSITLPRTLSRKTVDEVWKDIHRNITGTSDSGPPAGSGPQERQQTFGEMTLEDFLMKAGVVREDMEIGSQGFGPFVGGSSERDRLGQGPSDHAGGESVPTLSLSPANAVPNQATMDVMQIDSFNKNQAASQQRQEAEWLRGMAQQQHQQQQQQQHQIMQQHAAEVAAAAAYANAAGKRMGNGAGPMVGIPGMGMPGPMGAVMGPGMAGANLAIGMGVGMGPGMGVVGGGMGGVNMGLATGSPLSHDSDNGQNGLSLSPMQYGMEGPLRGRKRGADGPVEKVVERRQKRMIKNRESAARSRARKQAYTVELEAEVSQLKEENMKLRKQQAVLKKTEEEAERRRKQMIEVLKTMSKNPVVSEGKILRRTRTATW